MHDRPPIAVWIIAAIVTLLPSLYLGSYLALVKRYPTYGAFEHHAAYRLESDLVQQVFAPLNWLDRKVRPGYWRVS